MTAAPVGTAEEAPALTTAPDAGPDSVPDSPEAERRSSGGFLARAALVTAVLSVAGSVLGLARDQALARLFGAGSETDAFLVAWTVPEFAATLLIEDGLAFALVPMFSLALARRARGASGDPVRALVASTLPRLALACTAAGALVVASAPWLVRALAPGLPDQALAVDCTRLTATCLVSFGLAGYCSAALRAHRRFLAPASIYVAYNTGIITAMFLLGGHWGVRSAAAGVAVGGVLMVAAQVPSLVRRLRGGGGQGEVAGPGVSGVAASDGRRTGSAAPVIPAGRGGGGATEEGRGDCGSPATSEEGRGGTGTPATPPDRRGDAATTRPMPAPAPTGTTPPAPATDDARTPTPTTPPDAAPHPPSAPRPHDPTDPARPFALALFGTVLLFALCRQSQVLIERFLASGLPSGAISHLNYAQKVAQIPMTLSLMLCTVTFPVVARALADGDTERARERVERDVALAACLVLLGAAVVVACAPQIIHLLFQRGAFTPADTAATAGVMRVYALGLLGQTVVGALARSYFSAGRASWYPLGAMAAGIAATAAIGAGAVGPWGVTGIAAANATGITVTAALLLAGMGPRSVPVRIRRVLGDLGRPVLAAAGATVTGALIADSLTAPGVSLAAGATAVVGVFVLLGLALGVPGVRPALTTVTARLTPTSPRSPGSPRSPTPSHEGTRMTASAPASVASASVASASADPVDTRARTGTLPRTGTPARTGTPTRTTAPTVPWVAMYHSVGDRSDDPYRVTVTPGRLNAQFRWLRRRGLRGVSVAELLAARARGEGRDLVGLTFDDGYADFVEHALPCLRRWGFGATLFVLPGRLGGDNAWDPLGPRKPLLTADGIRHAAAEGVEIGSHGLTHVDLTRADEAALKAETTESRALLSELIGAPIRGFCYPYGTVDARATEAVRAAGYTYACAIDPGPLTGPHALPRVHVGEGDTAVRLLLKTRLHRLRRRTAPGV